MDTEAFVGFGMKGYKSFSSDEISYFYLNNKINNIIGPNNSGKSNALSFLNNLIMPIATDKEFKKTYRCGSGISLGAKVVQFIKDSKPKNGIAKLSFSIGINTSHSKVKERLEKFESNPLALEIIKSRHFYDNDNKTIWFQFDIEEIKNYGRSELRLRTSQEQLEKIFADLKSDAERDRKKREYINCLYRLFPDRTGSGADLWAVWENIVINVINPFSFIPNIALIGSRRSINAADSSMPIDNISLNPGQDLARKLANVKNSENTKKYKKIWRDMITFLKSVTNEDIEDINIPNNTTVIQLVASDDSSRSIESLGDGIKEVVMYAFVSTITEGTLICIDEPELHLHPSLQKRFISYLIANTKNKYLFATHSQSIVDFQNCTITKATQRNGISTTNRIPSASELVDLLHMLGSRPSDLMQSNYIIWVEGPSDRIYIKKWINEVDNALIEGVHYSILFYGGSTLNSFSLEETADDVISMLRINRKAAIIIDSDKDSEDKSINSTKKRIIKEAEGLGIKYWITAGYTIENYLPSVKLKNAIKNSHGPTALEEWDYVDGRYDNPFKGMSGRNKVKVASVINGEVNIQELKYDAKEHINDIVEEIKRVNQVSD
jgi:AAA15 family ATPase/GTPase